jgi:hypothetical protein
MYPILRSLWPVLLICLFQYRYHLVTCTSIFIKTLFISIGLRPNTWYFLFCWNLFFIFIHLCLLFWAKFKESECLKIISVQSNSIFNFSCVQSPVLASGMFEWATCVTQKNCVNLIEADNMEMVKIVTSFLSFLVHCYYFVIHDLLALAISLYFSLFDYF